MKTDNYWNEKLKGFTEYAPKDKMFTSPEEINAIEEYFQLKTLSVEDLTSVRNLVVAHYTTMMEEGTMADKSRLMSAMQSITTVIDHRIYNS